MSTTINRPGADDVAVLPGAPRTGRARASAARLLSRLPRADIVIPLVAMAILAPLYAALSLRNHAELRTTGFDLGIFVEEAKAYAELRAPVVPLLGPGYNALGDHFSPAMALFGPLFRVFPSAQTLLVAQAVLFALAVVPLSRWAVRSLGVGAGIVVAIGYGLSWGVQAALNFDFHEIALAVPLLAFSVTALGNRRWTAALLYALPLVFVKEDLGLTVAVIGALVAFWTPGTMRRWGLATIVWGLGWTALAVKVIVPALSADGQYGQASKLPSGGIASAVDAVTNGVIGGDPRAATLFLLLLVTGFAALRSPLVLVAVPTLAWRFVSDNTSFWGPVFHYSAVLMPIMFAALIDALVRGRRDGWFTDRGRRVVLAVVAVVALVATPSLPLAKLAQADTWRPNAQVTAVHALAAQIPHGATVAASNNLIPQLAADHAVSVFPRRVGGVVGGNVDTDWIVVNVGDPPGWPRDADGDREALRDARAAGYVEVGNRDGLLLLRRQ
ncbi:DUF2079 domain-containing protein [Aldersonia sp. NBC_00410]|uniref:DUF2079 domain-containing protein n=1 Tax=Aldersonia sp. NBC_00410 TaxID=2975954 RepID=UPI00224ED6C1|nr:DUF2079 domain-containing protein [Aldersonia sp. NBC_00410]MCX5045575.1 DUF2079 domain-containing protein [Aldersonia sp. NBC_00410]